MRPNIQMHVLPKILFSTAVFPRHVYVNEVTLKLAECKSSPTWCVFSQTECHLIFSVLTFYMFFSFWLSTLVHTWFNIFIMINILFTGMRDNGLDGSKTDSALFPDTRYKRKQKAFPKLVFYMPLLHRPQSTGTSSVGYGVIRRYYEVILKGLKLSRF